ncbi:MAG: M20 family metallopeptidase, partial [Bacteroidales bacterium]
EQKLTQWNIPFQSGYSGYGVLACIQGRNPDKRCVALRSDMDALPIEEATGLSFSSKNEGVMHACGHDVHMACLLGAAHILQQMRDKLEGTIKLLFQPSEEDFRAGAPVMIKEGVLENPRPEKIYALHVLPEMPCGQLGFKEGQYMASTDEIYLNVKGKAGHGATPELNVDTVLTAAYILTGLQQIVSRQAPPYIPTVLSFGRIIGEGRTNINPGEVKIDGTLRTFDEQWRSRAHDRIKICAENIAQAMGASCEVFIDHGYPFVWNNAQATAKARSLAESLLGKDKVKELNLRMTAEDFAYYTHEIPGCLFRLGTAKESTDNTHANLHTDCFDVDERAIAIGVEMFSILGFRS